MTRLDQARAAISAAQAALDAAALDAQNINAQEIDIRRRYPASVDALERATLSLALQQEIPALKQRAELRHQSALRDMAGAQAALQAAELEIEQLRVSIARQTERTGAGGHYEMEIERIRAEADAQIAAIERSRRVELDELPTMQQRLDALTA